MNNATTKCINGTLAVGDLVISTPDDDYTCLIGHVTWINLLGTPEHNEETDNDTDDVHVNFIEFDYSEQRIKEIEEMFSELYNEHKPFDECPIDDTIMAPCNLIRITGIKDEQLQSLLENGFNAACYCYGILSELFQQPQGSGYIRLMAACPECGNTELIRIVKDGESDFECSTCGAFARSEDLVLKSEDEIQ